MKLEYLRIENFKNLRRCELEFEGNFNAFIGDNGCGKSNLVEAILHILLGAYFKQNPSFSFELRFEVHRRQMRLTNVNGRLEASVDTVELSLDRLATRLREGPAQVHYPDLTFAYYSGDCRRLRNLIRRYERNFLRLAKEPGTENHRPLFVESSNQQAKTILLALFAHDHRPLLERFGAISLSSVSIVLESPQGFDSRRDEPMLWGTRGMIGRTLSAIEACADSDLSSRRRTLNPDETYKEERTYKFDENGADLDRLAQRLLRDGDNLYLALEHLRSRKILKSVSFKLARKDRSRFDFDHLSEGEKQILAVIGGLTLANQPENLILLDEPDTHLNPQWSWDFTEMLGEALAPARRRGSSTLMTTHDPVMISGLMREEVFVADTRSDGDFKRPIRDPRGQGIGNLICSGEFFGLPSSLDKESQKFLDERLRLSMKLTLTTSDKERLRELNRILEFLSPGISERDPEYAAFLRQRNTSGGHL